MKRRMPLKRNGALASAAAQRKKGGIPDDAPKDERGWSCAELVCPVCEEKFLVPWVTRMRRKTCSYECRDQLIKDKLKDRAGKKNPGYKHGQDVGRNIASTFSLKLKGEDRCRNCGSTYDLHLHHVIPRSKCKATKKELLNGMPLCHTCHDGWHHHKVTIYRDLFTAEEWAFLSSVELTGERIEAWLDGHYPERLSPVSERAA